jgi:hypothetical protein
MVPLSNQTTKNYLKVCNAYNAFNGPGTDGTLTIENLETILVCLRSLSEYPLIDPITDTPVILDQKETTLTGNLNIKNEQTPGGMFGNTTSTTAS